ncbi:Phage Mu protein F like protein [Candidatus Hepatincolaceae symbiont of Richtersius coronifer]
MSQLGSPRRLKTIYDANKRSARAAATWSKAQDTKDFAPFFQYKLGPSSKHRDQHKSWENTILPIDHPFWNYAMPPNGWGCKCFVIQITKKQAELQGGFSPNPKLDFLTTEKQGVKIKHLKGVDPAWSSNSGKFRNKILSESLEKKLLEVPSTMAKSQISSIVASKYFTSFFNKSKKIQPEMKAIQPKEYNFVPVGYVNKGIVKEHQIIRLSEDTLANIKVSNPKIKAEDYGLIQEIIDSRHYNKKHKAYIKKIGKYGYVVAANFTKERELLLTNFYRLNDNELKEFSN